LAERKADVVASDRRSGGYGDHDDDRDAAVIVA
jgi:hypothetical protein